jgi:hypothetical protein
MKTFLLVVYPLPDRNRCCRVVVAVRAAAHVDELMPRTRTLAAGEPIAAEVLVFRPAPACWHWSRGSPSARPPRTPGRSGSRAPTPARRPDPARAQS